MDGVFNVGFFQLPNVFAQFSSVECLCLGFRNELVWLLYRVLNAPSEDDNSVYDNDIGLYRDDGLAAFDKPPREIENIKKDICKVFKENNLKITIEANKKSINYLDITLDLRSSFYKPFMKPGNTLLYVSYYSNHLPAIPRSIPDAINKRL